MSIYRAVKSDPPHNQEVVLYYKINPCSSLQTSKTSKGKDLKNTCTQQYCFTYHNSQERRRPVFNENTHELLYEAQPCPSLYGQVKCLEGEKCGYSHTENEVLYHPLYYKTQSCTGCQFDNIAKLCPKYHTDEVNRSLVLERFLTKKGKENSNSQTRGEVGTLKPFILETFKTKLCTSKGNHNPKICTFYHSEQDKRRPTQIHNYSPFPCTFKKMCPHGDNCKFSHSKVEQLYHPDRYKKKFCRDHPHNVQKCKYGNYCSFAHSEEEIKIKLLHNLKKDENFYIHSYKTVFCPYISDHDRNQCVYAHNPQDFRRDPSEYDYSPIQCPDWSKGQIYTYEEGRCPRGMNCESCHGWKELDYHPLCYKTKQCNNVKGCKKIDCPFLHGDRQEQGDRQDKFFGEIGFKEDLRMQNKKEDSISSINNNLKNEPKFYFGNQFQNQTIGSMNFQYRQSERPDTGNRKSSFNKFNQTEFNRQGHQNNSINGRSYSHAQDFSINREEEKNLDQSEDNRFQKKFFELLQENGLDYIVSALFAININLERLLQFQKTNFANFPQIRQEDKEKLTSITHKILNENDWAPIQSDFHKPYTVLSKEKNQENRSQTILAHHQNYKRDYQNLYFDDKHSFS